jgi:hypothetical protein
MTRYSIDFDSDKIGLRVLLDAARYRFAQEQRKSPLWGRDICLFKYLKALIPALESDPWGFSTDQYGAENLALLLVPLAKSIQERLDNKQPITAQEELVDRVALNSIARLLKQLKPTKEA